MRGLRYLLNVLRGSDGGSDELPAAGPGTRNPWTGTYSAPCNPCRPEFYQDAKRWRTKARGREATIRRLLVEVEQARSQGARFSERLDGLAQTMTDVIHAYNCAPKGGIPEHLLAEVIQAVAGTAKSQLDLHD